MEHVYGIYERYYAYDEYSCIYLSANLTFPLYSSFEKALDAKAIFIQKDGKDIILDDNNKHLEKYYIQIIAVD